MKKALVIAVGVAALIVVAAVVVVMLLAENYGERLKAQCEQEIARIDQRQGRTTSEQYHVERLKQCISDHTRGARR